MKLNIKKFMMTEMGGELEETIKAWDQALEERRKATPGIGDPDQGIGFGYWDRTCKSCQDRWEVFKLAIRQFYGIEMYILSQDKTRIYNMSGHIEGIGYEESKDYKQRKSENIRHTIQVFDGCAEEIAEFKTKEDCMLVIYAIFKGMEQDSKAVEIPTQEEMEKQKDLIKQLAEAGQEVAAGIEDLLKEMFNGE